MINMFDLFLVIVKRHLDVICDYNDEASFVYFYFCWAGERLEAEPFLIQVVGTV
jgi:hypothetical protein